MYVSFPQDNCLTCKGAGVVDGMKHVTLDIPAGAVHSTSIAFFSFYLFQKCAHDHNFILFGVTKCNYPVYPNRVAGSRICTGATGNFPPQCVYS